MKLEELLRHVADNVENGRNAGHGLIMYNEPSVADHPTQITWVRSEAYSLAPRMVRINGMEVKAGMSKAPKDGEEIYVCDINNIIKADDTTMFSTGNERHLRWLEQGLIHRNYEDFKAMTEAMLSFEDITPN